MIQILLNIRIEDVVVKPKLPFWTRVTCLSYFNNYHVLLELAEASSMAEEEEQEHPSNKNEQEQEQEQNLPPSSDPPLPFDPSRMVGIIKRKALIKDLAAAYHAECLHYCQELLELQTKWEEPFIDLKPLEESKKEPARPSKRMKKLR